jgi:hypothetical protein
MGEKSERKKKIIIKNFAQNFMKNFENLVRNGTDGMGKNPLKSNIVQPFITNWLSIKKWFGDIERYNVIYYMLRLDNQCPRIDFFDDVFGYYIISLNHIICKIGNQMIQGFSLIPDDLFHFNLMIHLGYV